MTEHDIKTFLTIGENIVIEFKRAGDGPKADTYESICAFLNRNGGDLFLGVADDGKVIGLPPKAAPMMVRQIVNVMNDPNLWEPRIAVYPEIVKYRGKTLIHIHVPTGPDVYWFKSKCYDRVDDADVIVRGTSPIADMFIRKREIFTEQRVFPYVTKADLRLDLLPRVRIMAQTAHNGSHPWTGADDDAILRSAKLLGQDPATGKEGFNAAAVLLLGKDDTIGNCFPAYKTDALLRRVNVDRYDDRVTVRADELGSGVRNLYHYVRLYSGSDPVFDEKDIFRLTVPLDADYSPEKGNMRRVDGTTEKATEKTAEKTTEKVRECSSAESRLRAIIARTPTVSMAEMAREMNMSEDGIYYHIKALKDAGKLRRIGGRKTGHWEFVDRGKN